MELIAYDINHQLEYEWETKQMASVNLRGLSGTRTARAKNNIYLSKLRDLTDAVA